MEPPNCVLEAIDLEGKQHFALVRCDNQNINSGGDI